MTEMVERVGRALAEADGYAYAPYPYDVWARAAIEAMREPTESMIRVGEDWSADAITHHDSRNPKSPPVEAWKAMIEAALALDNDEVRKVLEE